MTENRLFLGVENSATGRTWRDRLDERGAARALAIAQRHGLPELLARILAGRNIEVDTVDAFLGLHREEFIARPYRAIERPPAAGNEGARLGRVRAATSVRALHLHGLVKQMRAQRLRRNGR